MACPHVSGGAALVLQNNPTVSSSEILQTLHATAWTDELTGLFPSDVNKELHVGEGGAPQPVPTPAPPPGSWSISGSGSVVNAIGDEQCISSNIHPGSYGNNEECTVEMTDIVVRVAAFNTEARYDFLTVGGVRYSGSSGPSGGRYTGAIQWSSDYSVVTSGWRLCFDV